jgi:hypothetical protein
MTIRTIHHKGKVGISSVFIIVVAVIVLISVSCAGQQAPAPTPLPAPAPTPMPPPAPSLPPPSPSPQTPPAGKWVADGIISAGEYTRTRSFDSYYEISWASDDTYVYIAMKAKASGWVALGIQPGSRMKDADMIIGSVKDGKAGMNDLFSTGDFGPHPPDIQQGGTHNILEFGGREGDGYTIIEFKRALDTGDKYDKPFVKGVNKIIWAYGSDYSLNMKHSNRGYGELELP